MGALNVDHFKGQNLLSNPNTSVHSIADGVKGSEVMLFSTTALQAIEVTRSLGDTTGKIIIDAMNIVNKQRPENCTSTADAIFDHTLTIDRIKCFNMTAANNLADLFVYFRLC